MITYVTGDLLQSNAEALVNAVNTVGVMGKGIALQFKKQYPNNFKKYVKACKQKDVQIGHLFVTEESNLDKTQLIVNFPTKEHWRNSSKYEYIESGLKALVDLIEKRQIKSIAIPALGTGLGGLKWLKVKKLLEKYLSEIEAQVLIYKPNSYIK